METKTHVIYTLKWEKEQYPLMTEDYQESKILKNGTFLHKVCSIYEASLARHKGIDTRTVEVSEIRQVLREEIQRVLQPEFRVAQSKLTGNEHILSEKDAESLGPALDSI